MTLSRIGALVAVAQLFVSLAMIVASDAEGWFGGLAYASMYAAPLLLVAVALSSRRSGWRTAAGWAALALGVAYTAVVAGNWAGYTNAQAVIAILLTAPTVALDAVIFWSTVVAPKSPPAYRQDGAATTGR